MRIIHLITLGETPHRLTLPWLLIAFNGGLGLGLLIVALYEMVSRDTEGSIPLLMLSLPIALYCSLYLIPVKGDLCDTDH